MVKGRQLQVGVPEQLTGTSAQNDAGCGSQFKHCG